MESSLSRIYKFFSNWIVYILSLLICGGLGYTLFNINQNIELTKITKFHDLYDIMIANPLEFFLALGSTLLLVILISVVIPITFKKFGKIYIIIPIFLIIGNIIGYYYGFGLHVFLINIAILILAVIIIAISILISLPKE